MLAEAITKIQQLVEVPKIHVVDGLSYVTGQMKLLAPPLPDLAHLITLTGLANFIRAYPGGLASDRWFIDVHGHDQVTIRAFQADGYGQRILLADCSLQDGAVFRFGEFQERESFVIGLMTRFVETPALQQLLHLISTLSTDGVTQSEDDGVSQKTTVKQGISLKGAVTVQSRWTLQPYRTFREIEQPASQFVLRLKADPGEVPRCALFEADGGRWRLDAMLSIKQWLAQQDLGLPIVA